MLAALAMTLALTQPVTQLSVQPWTGKDLATTTSTAAKYKLIVKGKPNTTVSLVASGFAQGWIAAFCTSTVCAPVRVMVTLPASGETDIAFELIRETDDAPNTSGAHIAGDGAAVDIPPATRN
jgi:hypothetical protein